MKKKGLSYAHILVLIALFTILIVYSMPVIQPMSYKEKDGDNEYKNYVNVSTGRFVDEYNQDANNDKIIKYEGHVGRSIGTVTLIGQPANEVGIDNVSDFKELYNPKGDCETINDADCRVGDVEVSFEMIDGNENSVPLFNNLKKVFKDGDTIVFEERGQ